VMIKEIKPPAYPTDSTEWIEQATIAINSAVGVSETMGAISDQISARQIQSVRGAIIVASGLGIVVIITLLLFFRDLTRAGRMLGRITSELESLSAGDLARRITFRRASVTSNEAVSGDNEMDAIAMGVNRMADNLEKSMTSLRSARDDLETRVAERTQEVLSAKEMAENADQAKSDFLAHMSHELRTPLNAVLGFADAIRHEISGPVGNATYKGYIEDIHTSAGHLLNLINDILDLSKIEAREMVVESEEVELGDLLSECTNLIAMQAEAAGLLIRIDEPTTPVTLYVDRRALKQIVLNLLSNAIKFSDTGREILIKAALEDDGRFGLSVIDQGVGMTPIGIEWAFKPYGQTSNHKTKSHQGTGLGLPLSKGLVEAHGGKLLLESELGHGTTVTIMLPASRVVR
jgi:signal transduction histidine kinase